MYICMHKVIGMWIHGQPLPLPVALPLLLLLPASAPKPPSLLYVEKQIGHWRRNSDERSRGKDSLSEHRLWYGLVPAPSWQHTTLVDSTHICLWIIITIIIKIIIIQHQKTVTFARTNWTTYQRNNNNNKPTTTSTTIRSHTLKCGVCLIQTVLIENTGAYKKNIFEMYKTPHHNIR